MATSYSVRVLVATALLLAPITALALEAAGEEVAVLVEQVGEPAAPGLLAALLPPAARRVRALEPVG